jgi:hypothetical protein
MPVLKRQLARFDALRDSPLRYDERGGAVHLDHLVDLTRPADENGAVSGVTVEVPPDWFAPWAVVTAEGWSSLVRDSRTFTMTWEQIRSQRVGIRATHASRDPPGRDDSATWCPRTKGS